MGDIAYTQVRDCFVSLKYQQKYYLVRLLVYESKGLLVFEGTVLSY